MEENLHTSTCQDSKILKKDKDPTCTLQDLKRAWVLQDLKDQRPTWILEDLRDKSPACTLLDLKCTLLDLKDSQNIQEALENGKWISVLDLKKLAEAAQSETGKIKHPIKEETFDWRQINWRENTKKVKVPGNILGRRRHAFSAVELACMATPRMMRRGAVSYEESDVTAQYIRFLGDAISKRAYHQQNKPQLLPPPNLNLLVAPQTGRRGSLMEFTASSSYKETMKYSVLHTVNLEVHGQLAQRKLASVDNWNFDVFAFRRITEGRPLYNLGLHLFHTQGLIEKLNLDVVNVMRFLALVEEDYRPENCYHNSTHAADVTQALYCLLLEPKLFSQLTTAEMMASLMAAMCHDLDHPGVNQNYLLNTSSYLAFIHGTRSTLERHHCHQAKSIIIESELLDHLEEDVKKEIMTLMEAMILATDVSQHTEFLSHFKELIEDKNVDLSSREDRHFLLTIAIKAADISNPARILELSKIWSEHIMEEFFRQGDLERKLKIPISAFCDRYTTIIPKSQSGFFQFVALPLFQIWSSLFDTKFSNQLCNNILTNKEFWDKELEAMEADGTVMVNAADPPTPESENVKEGEKMGAEVNGAEVKGAEVKGSEVKGAELEVKEKSAETDQPATPEVH